MPHPLRRARLLLATTVIGAFLVATADGQTTAARVSGVVLDDVGGPVMGAVVTFENPTAVPSLFTTTTDDTGRFAIFGLRRGLWTVTVTATGFEKVELDLPVRVRGDTPPIKLTLRPAPAPGPRGALALVDVAQLQADLDRAEKLVAEDRIDEALALYEKSLAAVPALTTINRQIGDLYLRKRDRARALDAYQRLLDAAPEDPGARATVAALAYDLGLAAAATGEAEAAIRYLEQALAADPGEPRAAEARAALARLKNG